MKPTLYNDGLGTEETVLFSFKEPDLLVHQKRIECEIEYPHNISDCECFTENQMKYEN